MRIGFFQYSPVFNNYNTNIEQITTGLSKIDADLIVLPELATTGYFFTSSGEVTKASETIPGRTTDYMQKIAAEKNCRIVIGMAEKGKNRNYNSAVLIGKDGVEGLYRKMHLFAGEKETFSKGDLGFPIFDVDGVKIGLLVCFDHLYPEAARSLALKGAQVICHPSNLVLPEYAQLTTRVRSVENRIFWILANRWGSETRKGETLKYTGNSQITAPDGSILTSAPANENQLTVVDIDPGKALNKHITAENDLLADRRPDTYTNR